MIKAYHILGTINEDKYPIRKRNIAKQKLITLFDTLRYRSGLARISSLNGMLFPRIQ